MKSRRSEAEDVHRAAEDTGQFNPHSASPVFPSAERAVSTMVARDGIVTAPELMVMRFPEPRYAVKGLLVEGLSVLGGKPKVGKSWLALFVSLMVARGESSSGWGPVDRGDVLYIGLEDRGRRLKGRLGMLLDDGQPPEGLHLAWEWPRLDQGGLEKLERWIDEHPNCRLIVIDTWQRVRPPGRGNLDSYQQDYDAMSPIHDLVADAGVAVLLIHHLKKEVPEDWVDALSGSTGITGSADSVLALFRDRGRADAFLKGTGRDIDELDLALRFDAGRWELLGDGDHYRLSQERAAIVEALEFEGRPLSPKEVTEITDRTHGSTRKLMATMARDGVVHSDGGFYSLPELGNSGNPGNTALPQLPELPLLGEDSSDAL